MKEGPLTIFSLRHVIQVQLSYFFFSCLKNVSTENLLFLKAENF